LTSLSLSPSLSLSWCSNLSQPLQDVEVVVWEVRGKLLSDQPLGKVVLHRDAIKAEKGVLHEQWFPLLPADTEGSVSGEVKLELVLTEKALKIHLVSADNLTAADVNGFSDPYVVFHLLPDAGAHQEAKSKIKKKTLHPKYGEKFEL